MRVAQICAEYHPVPPIEGGAVETWIEEVSHRLNGSDICVCSIWRDQLKGLSPRGSVQYIYYKMGLAGKILLSTYKLPFKNENSFLYWLPYSFWCAWKLREFMPDVIHIHNRPQFVPVFRKLHPFAKIVLHVHQISAMEEKSLWKSHFFKKVDLFLGASQFLAQAIKIRFPELAQKVSFVYDGVDTVRFQPFWQVVETRQKKRMQLGVQDRRVFLYVGRLVENKGADILLEAFKKLCLERPHANAKLIFCGARGYSSGDVTPFMKKLFKEAESLGDSVSFTGYIPHGEIHEYFAAADLVIIPSLVEEGFGMIAIEAMASGLPVIVSDKGALPEVVRNRKDGIVVSDFSVGNLKASLSQCLDDPGLCASWGHEGRKRVEENFSWAKISRDMIDIYKELDGCAKS